MSEYQLIEEIKKISVGPDWDKAKKEWNLDHIVLLPKGEFSTCLCGHYPIRELCYLLNQLNGNETMVGNCCVVKFMGDDSNTKIFNAISKNKINQATIDYALDKGIINQWEYDLTSNLWRKRSMSQKQKFYFEKIKEGILKELIKNG